MLQKKIHKYTTAYLALHVSGTPSQETGTSPPSCQLLDNRLCMLCMLELSRKKLKADCCIALHWDKCTVYCQKNVENSKFFIDLNCCMFKQVKYKLYRSEVSLFPLIKVVP